MNITFTFIGITVLVSLVALSKPRLMHGMMMNPYLIRTQHQYYRFLTSGFIHKDHMHLLVNMLSFYFFGTAMEQVFAYIFGGLGSIYFIMLYLMAIVVSDIPTYFKERKNPAYNSLGASGGVAAIIASFILFEPLQKICLYFAICMPGFILGTIYIIYSYYQGRRSRDNINHDAHLFGTLFGFLYCIVLYPHAVSNFLEQVSRWRMF